MADKVSAHGYTLSQVRDWVSASCVAQGVPLVVTDLGVLSSVGVLLGAPGRKPSGGRVAATAATPQSLGPGQDLGSHA